MKLSWPLDKSFTDGKLDRLMSPKEAAQSQKRMPDFEYIHKELLRNGVNKNCSGQNTLRNAVSQAMIP